MRYSLASCLYSHLRGFNLNALHTMSHKQTNMRHYFLKYLQIYEILPLLSTELNFQQVDKITTRLVRRGTVSAASQPPGFESRTSNCPSVQHPNTRGRRQSSYTEQEVKLRCEHTHIHTWGVYWCHGVGGEQLISHVSIIGGSVKNWLVWRMNLQKWIIS